MTMTPELPRHINDTTEFTAHGIVWVIRKISATEFSLRKKFTGSPYNLGDVGMAGRARFGIAREIREDIGYVLENGVLPPRKRS